MKSSWQHLRLGVAVFLLLVTVALATSQDAGSEYREPVQLAVLENQAIKESSGLAASRRNKNIYWTHNDSGDEAVLYALDRQGKHRGIWRVNGATAQDWEDIAVWKDAKSGRSYIYIGDIGNNSRKREFLTIYRIAEPVVSATDAATMKAKPAQTAPAEVLKLRYPEGNFDAETLMIHPQTGDLYIVTKVMNAAAKVFKLKAPFMQKSEATLTQVGELQVANFTKGLFTGGDISPDGHRVALCDYLGGYEITLPDQQGANFDDIWKQPVKTINLGKRKQGEALAYSADGRSLLATSEGLPCPLIEIVRSRK